MQEQAESIKLKIKRALQIGRSLRFVWQSTKGWTIANSILVVIQGVLPLLPLYLMKLIVDAVTAGLTAPDKAAALRHVMLLVGFMGSVILFGFLVRLIAR